MNYNGKYILNMALLLRRHRLWRALDPVSLPTWFDKERGCRGTHQARNPSTGLPHEDRAFVSNLVDSVSQDEIELLWGIVGLSANTSSLKGVSQFVENMCKDPKDALRLCTIALRSRYSHMNMYDTLMMEMYAKAGFLRHSYHMLRTSLEGGLVPYTDVMQALVQAGKDRRQPAFASQILNLMERHQMNPSKKILKIVMDTYADGRMPEEAISVLDLMKTRGMYVDVHAYTLCVKACIGSKKSTNYMDSCIVKDIMSNFEKIPHRTWTTILMAYASTGNVRQAAAHADTMAASGLHLNSKDYTALLRACRESGDVGQARKMLHRIKSAESAGIDQDISLTTEMIRVYAMCGELENSINIFNEIIESGIRPDKGIFNIMIDILMGHWSDATDQHEQAQHMSQARRVFDIAWQGGVFAAEKYSHKGRTKHVDLHRSGLWTSQFIIMKSLGDAAEAYYSGKNIWAIKFITGKGKYTRDKLKVSLADIVGTFLYKSGITYHEDSLGVFNVPKGCLHRIFQSGDELMCTQFSFVDPRYL